MKKLSINHSRQTGLRFLRSLTAFHQILTDWSGFLGPQLLRFKIFDSSSFQILFFKSNTQLNQRFQSKLPLFAITLVTTLLNNYCIYLISLKIVCELSQVLNLLLYYKICGLSFALHSVIEGDGMIFNKPNEQQSILKLRGRFRSLSFLTGEVCLRFIWEDYCFHIILIVSFALCAFWYYELWFLL